MILSAIIRRTQVIAEACSTHPQLSRDDNAKMADLIANSKIADTQVVLVSLLLNITTKTGTYAQSFNLTIENLLTHHWDVEGKAKLIRACSCDFDRLYPELNACSEKNRKKWMERINIEYSALYMAFMEYSHMRPITPLELSQKKRLPLEHKYQEEDDLFSEIYATKCSIEGKVATNPFYSEVFSIPISSSDERKCIEKHFSLSASLLRKVTTKFLPVEVDDYLEANHPIEIELYSYHVVN